MTCQRQKDGSVILRQVNAFEYNTLWELPALADPAGHEGAENRLYPPPYLEGEATEEQQADWEEFVRPDLELNLGSSMANMISDLEKAMREATPQVPEESEDEDEDEDEEADEEQEKEEEQEDGNAEPPGRWTFAIPADHVEDWFRAMNAARLVMSQRYGSHRSDMEYVLEAINSGTTTRLVQYELLTNLCDWWVSTLMQ